MDARYLKLRKVIVDVMQNKDYPDVFAIVDEDTEVPGIVVLDTNFIIAEFHSWDSSLAIYLKVGEDRFYWTPDDFKIGRGEARCIWATWQKILGTDEELEIENEDDLF